MVELLNWKETKGHIGALCALWNEEYGDQFPMSERLFAQNSIECPHILSDGSYTIQKDGEIIAWIVSKLTGERRDVLSEKTGWINSLLVSRSYRGQGFGSKLLELAEGAFRSQGVKRIMLGRDVHHYFPGIPFGRSQTSQTEEWFRKRGYRYVDMDRDYYRKSPDCYETSITDVECSVLKDSEKDDLLSFFHRSFPGRWEYEAWDYFRAGGDGRHFMAARIEGEIIGFVRVNDMDSPVIGPNVYWDQAFAGKLIGIGPLGIARQYRKKGYGKAIVESAIQLAVEREAEHLIIDWTGLDTFYRQFGFEVRHEYKHFEKLLD